MNAADKDQVKQRARHARRRHSGILDAWKDVLSTPQGRRLFTYILDQLQPRMNLWNRDAACLAFNVARHDVALWIREQIDAADADLFITMLQEQRLQEKQESSEREALQISKAKKQDPSTEE